MNRPITNAAPKCQTADHRFHRRLFLQGLAGTGALSMMSWGGLFSLPAFAENAKKITCGAEVNSNAFTVLASFA